MILMELAEKSLITGQGLTAPGPIAAVAFSAAGTTSG